MSARPSVRASFAASSGGKPMAVHFNPTSLQYQATTQVRARRGNSQQTAQSTTAQLSMELVFDTTDTGGDACVESDKLLVMMRPGEGNVIPLVTFAWGRFSFDGYLTQFRETVEFFSDDGVPLRSVVSVTLDQPRTLFESRSVASDGASLAPTRDAWAQAPLPEKTFPADAPTRRPDRAGRTASDDVTPAPAAGVGLSLAAGLRVGVGASIGVGATMGAGLRTTGAVSAGVTAAAGAFAGLRVSAGARVSVAGPAREDAVRGEGAEVSAQAVFAPGGRVIARSATRVRFDGG